MNPDPIYERLREIGWRRPLTEAEQAELRQWLVAHPEHQAEAEADAALSHALAKLPDAPMPSNFTSRVIETIERESRATERRMRQPSVSVWRLWLPRFAMAAVIVTVGGVAYWRNQVTKQQELTATAKNLVTVAGTSALSDPVVLEDFEVIRRMSQADDGLLALSDDLLSLKQ